MATPRFLAASLVLALAVSAGVGDRGPLEFTNGTPAQQDRMRQAAARFAALDLDLPPLQVSFFDSAEPCAGHLGLFRPGEVSVCSETDFVYEHELAHAWLHANVSEAGRRAFMELRGLDVWSDAEVPWNERGIEDAAFVVQQGLLDMPLPDPVPKEIAERLVAFALLTGKESSRLAGSVSGSGDRAP